MATPKPVFAFSSRNSPKTLVYFCVSLLCKERTKGYRRQDSNIIIPADKRAWKHSGRLESPLLLAAVEIINFILKYAETC